ncbi:hypothetical protein [uncultured Methanobrevibacter sp.]|uniref:hypothetical protein n=1 Tax=uncultured Methanobrevibacter sp. TaxID=253161 RepID=UPI0025FAD975|nr:hypothetical protein [uncultured Methanobrevibacter sp.]
MNTTDKIKKSWWVLFPFTFIFPGVGFIYIGMKFDNKKWILEGITYEVPWFFYLLSSSIYPSHVMLVYYVWILLLAAFIALVRSIMVAIKLVDVYEMGETPKVASSSSTSSIAKAREDSKIGACCVCIIFIFIIFAFVAIL